MGRAARASPGRGRRRRPPIPTEAARSRAQAPASTPPLDAVDPRHRRVSGLRLVDRRVEPIQQVLHDPAPPAPRRSSGTRRTGRAMAVAGHVHVQRGVHGLRRGLSDANGQSAADAVRWVSVASRLAITAHERGVLHCRRELSRGRDRAGRGRGRDQRGRIHVGEREPETGTGSLGGTLTGTIPAGASRVQLDGVTYEGRGRRRLDSDAGGRRQREARRQRALCSRVWSGGRAGVHHPAGPIDCRSADSGAADRHRAGRLRQRGVDLDGTRSW